MKLEELVKPPYQSNGMKCKLCNQYVTADIPSSYYLEADIGRIVRIITANVYSHWREKHPFEWLIVNVS